MLIICCVIFQIYVIDSSDGKRFEETSLVRMFPLKNDLIQSSQVLVICCLLPHTVQMCYCIYPEAD